MPTVFISYSHDSEAHRQQVLALSERLRQDQIETRLDQYVNGTPKQGWPLWMLDQLDEADFVLVICTETYYRRFRRREEPGKGKGVRWEGALITQEIYDDADRSLKYIPVVFAEDDLKFRPEPIRPASHYVLTSEANYQSLLDYLLGQAGVEARPVEAIKPRPRKTGTPLTFADSPSVKPIPADISRIVRYAPTELIGREAETKLLNDAWNLALGTQSFQPAGVADGNAPAGGDALSAQARTPEAVRTQARPHVLTFVAMGGEGKTSLVVDWAANLAAKDWPGCEAAFAWSFYSQGTREQAAASSDLFLAEALRFFGDEETAASAKGAYEKGQRLARLVGQRRALLILDGLEPLQHAPTSPMPGELKDQGIAALLKGLAATNRGLCVVTTRYAIPDLRAFLGKTVREETLMRLSKTAGVALLKAIGVKGTLAEYEKLVEDVQGHALTLQIVGQFLARAFQGDIRKRDRVKFEKADAKIQGGHAFRAMDAYVDWLQNDSDEARREIALLSLMGLFDRPASADCLEALLQPPAIPNLTEPLVGLSEDDLWFSLTALRDTKLITFHDEAGGLHRSSFRLPTSIDAHPLVREYFSERMKAEGGMRNGGRNSSFIIPNSSFQEAHRRLYEHLCATTKEGETPTLEELQPLYQAVAHGCLAGLQQEACEKVYRDRIMRRQEAYAVKKLGAFGSDLGAVACFFEVPWSRVSPALTESYQAWLLNEAAFRLRALGRLTESLEPMRAATDWAASKESWKYAAVGAGNLSELELTLGPVAAAVRDAEQSVEYADLSGDAFQRMLNRTTHADALHQAGRRAEAESLFQAAEQMWAETYPQTPLMSSILGFRYCDILLSEVERMAWHKGKGNRRNDELLVACRAVTERSTQTLKWEESWRRLLDIALNHLTLGRAALYQTILSSTSLSSFILPTSSLSQAVTGLRRSGNQHHLPRGLLTRAWLRALTGALTGPDSAQEDLDEACDIAERGSMKLFMADIHLYRARLFGRMKAEGGMINETVKTYPWESAEHDLAEAERLINECGYHRRDAELADAKRTIL